MPDRTEDLPPRLSDALDRRVDDFDEAWNKGAQPELKKFLPKVFRDGESPPPPEWRLFVAELLTIDLEYRLRGTDSGESPRIEDYFGLIPWLPEDSAVLLEVIPAEYMIRSRTSDGVDAGEYRERFPTLGERLEERLEDAVAELVRESDASVPAVDDTDILSGVRILETLTPSGSEDTAFVPAKQSRSQFGDYEILHEIARGGMGVVYKATQKSLKRHVALKVILAGEFAQPADVKRFYAEAEAGGKLNHPNIVPVYEVGRIGVNHFYSMAFVDGPSLSEEVKTQAIEPQRAARLMHDVAGAIQYAHEHGIIHRDLKPSNVLIEEGNTPRVADFGLARQMNVESGVSIAGKPLGTASYMPPEQALGYVERSDERSDVYSLGATLYCLLTGRPPFQGASIAQTLSQVVYQDPVSLRRLNPAIPRDLENICLKCLNKSHESRYQSAAELQEDLQRFLIGVPTKARPVSTAERLLRFCRRRPGVASLLGVSAGLLIAAFSFAAAYYQERLERAADAINQNQEIARQALELERQLRRTEFNDYVIKLDSALTQWDAGDVESARSFHTDVMALENWDSLKGWEWNYLDQLLRQERRSFDAHDAQVVTARWSEDGRWFASASFDRKIKIGDVFADGETDRLRTLVPETDAALDDMVLDIGFVGDGSRLLSVSDRGTALLWDTDRGVLIGNPLDEPVAADRSDLDSDQVRGAVIARDGFHWVCYDDDGTVLVRSLETRTPVMRRQLSHRSIAAAAFDHSGERIALADDMTGRIVILSMTEEMERIFSEPCEDAVLALAFDPAGDRLAVVGTEGFVEIWMTRTGVRRENWKSEGGDVVSVSFDDHSGHLLTGSADRVIRRWDVHDKVVLDEFRGHQGPVYAVHSQPEGDLILSAGGDGKVRLWHPEGDVIDLPGIDPLTDVVIADDGGTIRYSSGNVVQYATFDEAGKAPPVTVDAGFQALATLDDSTGSFIVSSGGDTVLYGAIGTELRRLPVCTTQISQLCTSPSASLLAAVCAVENGQSADRHLLRVIDTTSGEALLESPLPVEVVRMSFCSKDRKLLVIDVDRNATLFDLQTGEPIANTVVSTSVESLNCCASPELAAVGGDGTVHLYDLSNLRLRAKLTGLNGNVNAVAFSPDGERLASADQNTVRIWAYKECFQFPEQHVELLTLKEKEFRVVTDLFWIEDGNTLLSISRGGGSGTARRWTSRRTPR